MNLPELWALAKEVDERLSNAIKEDANLISALKETKARLNALIGELRKAARRWEDVESDDPRLAPFRLTPELCEDHDEE
jgi:hypothetical protein